MLSADQITALQDSAQAFVEPVVEWLISDIAERIAAAGQFTSTASYEIWRAQNLGLSLEDIKKELQKKLNVTAGELEQLLRQAAEVGYNFDLSRLPTANAIPFAENTTLQQIVDAAVRMVGEDLENFTKTGGFVCPDGIPRTLSDAYRNACDFAFQKTVTGAQDYVSAIRDATRGLAEKGIVTIDYSSGKRYTVEAAVRRSVVGGMGLIVEEVNRQNFDALGCNGWEISAHSASAPDHEPIQGKQYPDAEYQRLNNSLKRRIGTLNCGHDAFPIILGVNSPQYTPAELEEMRKENEKGVTYGGKHYTLYEATQVQRKLERSIRRQKHRILVDEALQDTDKLQTDQIKYQMLTQEYKRFSKATGQRMQYERMEVAGFGPKQANAADKMANNRIAARKTEGNFLAEGRADAWDSSAGSQSWGNEKRRAMYSDEYDTVSKKYEVAYLYDSTGKEIFKKIGNAGAVDFSPAEIEQMRGCVLTHNHPNNSCFSPEDINMLRRGKLVEIRAVTSHGVYRLQKPVKWEKSIASLEKIENVYYDIDKEVSTPIFARAYHGDITFDQAEEMSQEAVIREFGKRYGLNFQFESWESLKEDMK